MHKNGKYRKINAIYLKCGGKLVEILLNKNYIIISIL